MKLNLPNKITVFRMFCVLVLIILGMVLNYSTSLHSFLLFGYEYSYVRIIFLIIFIISSFSDLLDGHIARKYNLITNFGKFLDPIADKLLVNITIIILTVLGECPIFVPIIFILRDTIVDGIRFMAAKRNIVIAASFLGKLKTTTQMTSTIICLALFPIDIKLVRVIILVLFSISSLVSIISGIDYIIKNKQVLEEE